MTQREPRTETIPLGEEVITGKTRRGRVLTKPVAKISLFQQNPVLAIENDVGKISFLVNAKYQEATEKEDVPNYQLEIFDSNDKLLGRKVWRGYEDVPSKYQEYEYALTVETDIEKYAGQTINLKAKLKCWLEESAWIPKGGGEETVSAEDEANIKLIVPEIRNPGPSEPSVSYTVIGRGLHKDEKPADYERQDIGKAYKLVALVVNNTDNKLAYGELDVYENGFRISDLSPAFKETKSGDTFSDLRRTSQEWKWYKANSDGRLAVTDKQAKTYNYKFDYYLRDEYGFEYKDVIDTPPKKLKIVISIPQYKLDAVEVYNDSFDAENEADFWSLVLEIDFILISAGFGYLADKVVGALIGLVGGAGLNLAVLRLGDNIARLATGKTVREAAQELRVKLKEIIDDPPKFDAKYKNLISVKPKKIKTPRGKDEYSKVFHKLNTTNLQLASELNAIIVTNNRSWSAQLKNDKKTHRKQTRKYKELKHKAVNNIKSLANKYEQLAHLWRRTKLTIKTAEFLNLQKLIKENGFPKHLTNVLAKYDYSKNKIVKLKNHLAAVHTDNLDLAKTYEKYATNLRKLSLSIRELKND